MPSNIPRDGLTTNFSIGPVARTSEPCCQVDANLVHRAVVETSAPVPFTLRTGGVRIARLGWHICTTEEIMTHLIVEQTFETGESSGALFVEPARA